MNGFPLLVMPCSSTKVATPGSIPALERYDGPMWRTLRAALRDINRPIDLWVLSARFGFIPATFSVPDYDHRMTEERAAEIARGPNVRAYAEAVCFSSAVLFAGGRMYRQAMRKACSPIPRDCSETTGLGIGYQRAELRAWLDRVAS